MEGSFRNMNIWIFNHHAQGPDIAGGTRHYDLAKQLIAKGHHVTIFAAGFHYTLLKETVEYNSDGYKQEQIDGVDFVWVKTFPYEKNNIKRMVNILSYGWKLLFLIPKLSLSKPDVIIGTTVHPIAPVVGYWFAKKYKTPFIFEIRDLWPQSFIDMGVWKKESFVAKVFKAIEAFSVKKADAIITLSPKTQTYLLEEYGYKDVVYIPNSVDVESADKNKQLDFNHPTFETLKLLQAKKRKIYMFTGAIVQSNSIGMFIEVAKKIDIEEITIVLVGKGQLRQKYEQMILQEKLGNIIFLDPVEKRMVPKLLSYADVLLLIQGNVQWGSSNKLYDYLCAKKPIITSLYVKHNDIVEEIGCGLSAQYENSDDMVAKIETMERLPQQQKQKMGENGYNYVKKNSDIKIMAQKLELLCKDLITKKESIKR